MNNKHQPINTDLHIHIPYPINEVRQHKHIHIPSSGIGDPFIDFNIYIETIIPKFGIENGTAFQITSINELYHMKGFSIITQHNRLERVDLFGRHPNADPDKGNLCLPDYLKSKEILDIEKLKFHIIWMLEQYYLDDCYFQPDINLYKRKPVDAQFEPIVVNFKKEL